MLKNSNRTKRKRRICQSAPVPDKINEHHLIDPNETLHYIKSIKLYCNFIISFNENNLLYTCFYILKYKNKYLFLIKIYLIIY